MTPVCSRPQSTFEGLALKWERASERKLCLCPGHRHLGSNPMAHPVESDIQQALGTSLWCEQDKQNPFPPGNLQFRKQKRHNQEGTQIAWQLLIICYRCSSAVKYRQMDTCIGMQGEEQVHGASTKLREASCLGWGVRVGVGVVGGKSRGRELQLNLEG